ncbi:hypothetical protein A9404_01140 [Halothiobacillus diazotrophicus]|uniref:Uncharacterized protein n=1 Tax=Halothiobacillus diazotrophicus TaxID=1860122 RepID=A0A191ZE68_9GAMM|nr:hypothetical protein A9404_01140 [Halothiobacillus diazotrophicus]
MPPEFARQDCAARRYKFAQQAGQINVSLAIISHANNLVFYRVVARVAMRSHRLADVVYKGVVSIRGEGFRWEQCP